MMMSESEDTSLQKYCEPAGLAGFEFAFSCLNSVGPFRSTISNRRPNFEFWLQTKDFVFLFLLSQVRNNDTNENYLYLYKYNMETELWLLH